ncbi:heterokaryon incompatibility [Pyrenophora seminiperda CCB06]|uniref:Heterokaryon incompatibility n=1 Tax=Pyrenophora seminiperda CCB06 TaxID=1302712 RepID=A0A3M7LYU1_9PLEO|nr:heterokaryon incompatibility [Pyrenophora seminiperda CCB06]
MYSSSLPNDLQKTFGEILNYDTATLHEQIIQIQKLKIDRQESSRWAQRLKFLDLSKVPDLGVQGKKTIVPRPTLTIPLTSQEDDDKSIEYVAVSWRWVEAHRVQADGYNTRALFEYYIQRSGEEPYKTDFPDSYMDRVIRFAQSKGIDKIWIDKDCIFQRDGDEKKYPGEHQCGVQAMDLVYGDSMAVGLLTTCLTKQRDIDVLGALLARRIFTKSKDENSRQLKEDTNVQGILTLIRYILHDERWDRVWIFQEDHLASTEMTLLIPHSHSLSKNTHSRYDFGDVDGELKVNLAGFRKAVTMFCLACSKSGEQESLKDIMDKVKQYNLYDTKTTTTLRVLDDVSSRSTKNEEDRLAIFANALRFKYRLNISDVSPFDISDKYSMSVAFLVLVLINGEIFNNNINMLDNIMAYTLRSYLERVQNEIDSPGPGYQLTYIDHCRFSDPEICDQGVKTKGLLWKLQTSAILRLDLGDREQLRRLHARRSTREKLSERDKEAIILLADKLERDRQTKKLSKFLRIQVKLDRPGKNHKKSTKYILDNLNPL